MAGPIFGSRDRPKRSAGRPLRILRSWLTDGTGRDAPSPGPRWADVRLLLRTPILGCLGALIAYAGIFTLVAGPDGARIPWKPRLDFNHLPSALLGSYAAISLLVATASTACAVFAKALATRRLDQVGPARARDRLLAAGWWSWLLGLAFALGCASSARLENDVSTAAVPAGAAIVGLLVGLAVVLRVGAFANAHWDVYLGWSLGWVAVFMRLSAVFWGGTAAATGTVRVIGQSVSVGELARGTAAIGVALALTGVRDLVTAHTNSLYTTSQVMFKMVARLLPFLLLIAVMARFEDFGPAVVLLVTIGCLTILAFGRNLFRIAFTLSMGLGGFFFLAGLQFNRIIPVSQIEHAGEVWEKRVKAGCSGGDATQACKSLRILHETGLWPQFRTGSGQPAGSLLVRHLENNGSDYGITTMSAWVGMALVVLLLVAVLTVCLRMCLLAVNSQKHLNGDSEEGWRLRTRVAVAASTHLAVPTMLLALAVLLPQIPLTNFKFPLTGLDAPFIAVNGSSAFVYAAMLAIGALMAKSLSTAGQNATLTKNHRVVARVSEQATFAVTAILLVSAMAIHLGWGGAGTTRLNGESLLRDAFTTVRTRDNVIYSRSNAEGGEPKLSLGGRSYPNPAWAVDLGLFLAKSSSNEAVGLDWLAAPTLTCGEYHDRGLFDTRATCTGADVVTTINAKAQNAAAYHAQEQVENITRDKVARDDVRADVVLLERATGAVVALASSDADNKKMQNLVTLTARPVDEAWDPPTLQSKRDVDGRYKPLKSEDLQDLDAQARVRALFAIAHLREPHIRCEDPQPNSRNANLPRGEDPLPPQRSNPFRPGQGWVKKWQDDIGPSEEQCLADKSQLRLMGAWQDRSQPGSTFKLVTGTAALVNKTEMPPAELSSPMTQVKDPDGNLVGIYPLVERSRLPRCAVQSVPQMLSQSCNTTAGWLGARTGWSKLRETAHILGFDTTSADRLGHEGGVLTGPPDPSDPSERYSTVYYSTSEFGPDPMKRDDTSAPTVAREVATTAIGQDEVRASILDMAGVMHAIVGAGPLAAGGTTSAVDPAGGYSEPPVLNLIAGACTSEKRAITHDYPIRHISQKVEAVFPTIRRGMWEAVHTRLGTADTLADADVIYAKSGTAQLDESNWARWIMAATDRYVVVARVMGLQQEGKRNYATQLVHDLLKDPNTESAAQQDTLATLCTKKPTETVE